MEQDQDSTQHFSPTAAETAVPVTWQEGDVILDQYEVRGILGEGGMGTVYHVYHRGWKSDLAVKSPKPGIFARDSGKENFIHEAETWIRLGLHPHIVSCYYVRTLGGIPRVFAEYVAGGSFAGWIRSRRFYAGGHQAALERMLDLAIQFAWGLHYAHEQGLVHQDVKPANVMIDAEGIAKVTDFGLAKAREVAGTPMQAHDGGQQSILVSSHGMTPAYCSPEQAQGQPLSRKTDIWSWGVSVLEMFVGTATWMHGALAREALASHQEQDPQIPPMPAALVKLLARCFQPQPQDRPATMLEVADELQSIYRDQLGRPSPRKLPRVAELLANSLNNRALSLYDLGQFAEAKQVWEQAFQADPRQIETIYNRGIALWRSGGLTDEMLVQQLEAVQVTQPESWQLAYLLAQVHLERGDKEAALPLLQKSLKLSAEKAEIQALLKRVQSGPLHVGRCLRVFRVETPEKSSALMEAVSLTADGSLALSGSFDNMVRLWDVNTGRCLHTFEGHTRPVSAVSLLADGRYALSGGWDGTLRLWDVKKGRCVRVMEGHKRDVKTIAVSADGSLALSGGNDRTLRLWDVKKGRCLRVMEGHANDEGPSVTNHVRSVSLSADGSTAISLSYKTLRLWEVSTGRCLRIFEQVPEEMCAVSLRADGGVALSTSYNGLLRLWEVSTGRCLRTFRGSADPVYSVSWSPDGNLAISGGMDTMLRLWEVSTGRCLRTFQGHTSGIDAVSFAADGRHAITGSSDHTLRWWELPRQEIFCQFSPSRVQSHTEISHVQSRAESLLEQAKKARAEQHIPQALQLLQQVRSLPGRERMPEVMEMWSELALSCVRTGLRAVWLARVFQGHTASVKSVCLSADGRYAFSASGDQTLRLWEVSTGNCLRTFQEPAQTRDPTSLSLSGDGKYLLAGNSDCRLHLWEVETGRYLRTFRGHTRPVHAVSLSTDGRYAFSAGDDGTLRLWEVSTGRCLRTLSEPLAHAVHLSADSRYVLSGSFEKLRLRLWEVSTGNCLRTFQGHTDFGTEVALSADGRYALSGGWDKTLRLWDLHTGNCLRTLQGHTNSVMAVSLSADSKYALSGSSDKTLSLWDVGTGRCLHTLQEHRGRVLAVALSPNGRYALSGSEDGELRLWELDWELQAHDPADWDEAARPFLETFLIQHTPYAGTLPADRQPSEEEIWQALTRSGQASWTDEDFQGLLRQLRCAGLGWLRPEGIRHQLREVASSWQPLMTPRKYPGPPKEEQENAKNRIRISGVYYPRKET